MNPPFEPTSTPAIERANRLMHLRAHPGFPDLTRISQDLVDDAAAISIDYPGWDVQQIAVLKARAQAAKEHHALLFAKIAEAIREGIQEQAASTNLSEKSPAEILETGDLVRQEVLTKFEEMSSEGRLPGTY
jgi:hypothetical protein